MPAAFSLAAIPMPDIPAPMMTTEGDLDGCPLREAIIRAVSEPSVPDHDRAEHDPPCQIGGEPSRPADPDHNHAHTKPSSQPAQRASATRSTADPGQGGTALRDFPGDALGAQALGGVLGLLEHVLCAVEVLGPAAGDQRAGPVSAGAGEEQRRAEALLDLGGGGEVALGLLVALQGRWRACRAPRSIDP